MSIIGSWPRRMGAAMVCVAVAGLVAPVGAGSAAAAGVSLIGTVTDAITGVPVGGIAISVDDADGNHHETTTATDGRYSISDIEWSPVTLTAHDATGTYAAVREDFELGGDPVVHDLHLERGGTIAGHVVDEAGAPIPGVCLAIISAGGYSIDSEICTDAAGAYRTFGLPPDAYSVDFEAGSTGFISEFYDDEETLETSTDVAVVAGATSVANAVLTRGGRIVGQVRGIDGGTPIAGASVRFESRTTYLDHYTSTDTEGRFGSPALPPGTYRVFVDPDDDIHLPRWFGDTSDAATAAIVTVTGGDATANVDLPVGAAVEGSITDNAGAPIAGACVAVSSPDEWHRVCGDSTGHYHAGGLAGGSYSFEFVADGYVREYSDGVSVPPSATTTGINASLARWGTITGTVTNTNGAAVTDGTVEAYLSGDDYPMASASLAADGSYELTDLDVGAYVVVATPANNASGAVTAYAGAVTIATATTVPVALDQAVTGINIRLRAGGRLVGTVTSAGPGGGPIAGACVEAYPSNGQLANVGSACTDARGRYTIVGLGQTNYTVIFDGPTTGTARYAGEYYNDTYDSQAATLVPVSIGATSTANASLTPLAAVRGTVRDSRDATPVTRARVVLRRVDGQSGFATASTNGSGAYTAYVLPGSYTIEVDDDSDRHRPQFYDHQSDQGAATPITITASGASGIDFALDPFPAVRGTVTSAGAPIAGVQVQAFAASDTQNVLTWATTDRDGSYEMLLEPGDYVFQAIDLKSRFVEQWYSAGSPAGVASIVSLVDTDRVLDFDVVRGGAITGTISGSDLDPKEVDVFPAAGGPPVVSFLSRYSGLFVSPALPAGQYRIRAADGGNTRFAGGADFLSASDVTVQVGRTTKLVDISFLSGDIAAPAAEPGDGRVTLTWPAPSSPASTVFDYRVDVSTDAGGTWSTYSDGASPATTAIVTGLTNGTAYAFRVTAVMESGLGPASASVTATPVAPVVEPSPPGPPGAVSLVAGSGALSATWTAPASDGGAPLTDYEIQVSSDAGASWTSIAHPPSTATTATIGAAGGHTYVVRVAAINAIGTGSWSPVSNAVTVAEFGSQGPPPAPFAPLPAPARLLDTRAGGVTIDGQFQAGGILTGNTVLALQVSGRAGLPTDAASVVLNVTAVDASAPGYLTVFPCGTTRPTAANVNYAAGQTIANEVIAKVGTSGQVCVYAYASTHVVVDVSGSLPSASSFEPLGAPARVLDTRPAPDGVTVDGQSVGIGRRAAGTVLELPIAGRAGVPATAASVVLNIAAVAPVGDGFITVFPCGVARPNAANLNYVRGQNVSNAVVAKIGTGGSVCIFTWAATDIVVDVSGDFASEANFAPLTSPARLLDTRPAPDGATADGLWVGIGRRAAGTVLELPVAGRAGVAGDAQSVALNVTAVDPSGSGYLAVYPCGVPRPNAANLNYLAGQVVPNAVIAKVGADGKVCIFTYAATDIVVDVAGTLG